MIKPLLVSATLAATSIATHANATLVTFTNQTAFENALGSPIVTENFAQSFSAGNVQLQLLHNANDTLLNNIQLDLQLVGTTLNLDFDSALPLSGIGINYALNLTEPVSFDIGVNSFNFGPLQTAGFFGFVNEDQFSQFNLANPIGTTNFNVTNLANNVAITEPASMAIFGFGLLGIAAWRRQKHCTN